MTAEPAYYEAEVLERRRLTPHMIRVRFGGEDLRGFASTGVPDERLGVFLPDEVEQRPPRAVVRDGRLEFPADRPRPERRVYTVRRFDAAGGEVEIDFLDHPGGRASAWAAQARRGQVVGLTHPNGWYEPPADAQWQLLIGDATALPAVGRIAEQLPAGAVVRTLIEVPDAADVQQLSTAADLDAAWITGSGHWLGPSDIERGVRELALPDAPGYVWAAGEASTMRALRRYVRDELGVPLARCTIVGYWRHAPEQWNERYARVSERVEQRYGEAVAAGLAGEELRAARDEILKDAGL